MNTAEQVTVTAGPREIAKDTRIISGLDTVTRWILWATAFLLPVWILPWGGMELSRATFFGVLILLAVGLQFVKVFLTGSISYIKSPVGIAIVALVAVTAASTFFSRASYASFGSADVLSERLLSVILYAFCYALMVSVLRRKNDPIVFVLWMIAGGVAWSVVSFAQYFGVNLPFDFAKRVDFNPIGTINGLALFYGFLLTVVGGILLGIKGKVGVRAARGGLWAAFAVFLLNLIVINYINAWVLFLISVIFLTWLYTHTLSREWESGGQTVELASQASRPPFRGKYFYFLLTLLIIPAVFIFIRVPLFSGIQFPLEVSPSFSATWDIGVKVLKQGALPATLGVGPGTFAYAYSAFHDQVINLTNLWGVRFGQGFSFLATSLATTGVLGFLAIIGIIISAVGSFGRILFKHENNNPFLPGVVAGAGFLLMTWIAYPANFTLLLISFAMLGLTVVSISDNISSRFIGAREIVWNAPWTIFLVSLGSIFLIGFTIAGVYYTEERYRAALTLEQAVIAIQQKGDLDGGVALLDKAAVIDSTSDQYQRFVAQGRLLKIQSIINSVLSSNPSSSTQTDFQREVSAAIGALQRAIQLNPLESFNFRTAGTVYETLIPFVPGADQSAVNAYARAIQLDPVNPLVFAEIAKTYMIIADTAQNLANQPKATSEQIKGYGDTRVSSLNSASAALKRSIELKNDFATGHFLLAQVALRQGKTDEAIVSAENARHLAPRDIGILFQVGLLYYQNQQYDRAKDAFTEALILNPNYSNARYFLGLILSGQGDRVEAIKNFEQIQALNSDNQEIKKILSNLRAKKPALDGIAPPPEKRKEVPIKEGAGSEKTPVKKKK